MTADVAIVIPNFNGAGILPATLGALEAQTVAPAQVVVVDNASSDESLELLRSRFGWVDVVAESRNHGFGGGVNRGVAKVSASSIVVLNSDARPLPDWLGRLTATPREGDVWALGSVLVSPEGVVESAGDCYDPGGFAYKAAGGAPVDALPGEPYEAFAPPGAAPLFDRERFLAIGGYDERYFLYYEDIDLSFRARLQGWRALVVPGARVEHELGASGTSSRTRYFVARNSIICATANMPELHPRLLAHNARREWRGARRDGYVPTYLRGRLAGAARLPRTLLERRARQRSRVASVAQVEAAYGLPPAVAHLGPLYP